MGNLHSETKTGPPVSKFYLACRSGDADAVKQMLPTMGLKEINCIEPNGSTALHVAAWYRHYKIVELLLKYGCSTMTTNKYGKTAAQECEDEQIRQLIQSSTVILDNDEGTNDHALKFYKNIDNQDKSVVTTKMMQLRLKTYLTSRFKTNGANPTEHIKKSLIHAISKNHPCYQQALTVLDEYEATQNLECLIYLYTLETPFYKYIRDNRDEVFLTELLIGLTAFQKRSYKGYTYRGNRFSRTELDSYESAWQHPGSFLETHSITSTSASRSVAEMFNSCNRSTEDKIPILFIFHFPERCEMAVNISEISVYPNEEEILIIPGAFFEVKSIKKELSTDGSSELTIIELKNIPVSREVLLKTINELK